MVASLYDSGLHAGELVGLDVGTVWWSEHQVQVMTDGEPFRRRALTQTIKRLGKRLSIPRLHLVLVSDMA